MFYHLRGCAIISHLMYVDNLLVFTNGAPRSLTQLLKILGVYESWASQAVNKAKSTLYFLDMIDTSKKRSLLCMIGFVEGSFPFIYLGALIITGRLMARLFGPLVQKIKNKVSSWKGKMLSQEGSLVLILHVLSSMVTHTLAVLLVPQVVGSLENQLYYLKKVFREIAKANISGAPNSSCANQLWKVVLVCIIWER